MGLLTSNSPGSVVPSHEDGNSRSLLQATLVMRTVRYYGDSSYYPGKKISNHLKKYAADREGAEADNSLRDLQNWWDHTQPQSYWDHTEPHIIIAKWLSQLCTKHPSLRALQCHHSFRVWSFSCASPHWQCRRIHKRGYGCSRREKSPRRISRREPPSSSKALTLAVGLVKYRFIEEWKIEECSTP